jgi:hypothetical protein
MRQSMTPQLVDGRHRCNFHRAAASNAQHLGTLIKRD